MPITVPPWLESAVPGLVRGGKNPNDPDTGPPAGLPNLWVVIHTAETAEANYAAENLDAYSADNRIYASWDFGIDNDSIVMTVPYPRTSWAAPGINGRCWNLEHAGRAGQGAAGWQDAFSKAMLERSARLVAALCTRCPDGPIPIRKVGASDILAGRGGIVGHDDVTRAYPAQGTGHTDPGSAFPWAWYIGRVQAYANSMNGTPTPAPGPAPAPGVEEIRTTRTRATCREKPYLDSREVNNFPPGKALKLTRTAKGDILPGDDRQDPIWVRVPGPAGGWVPRTQFAPPYALNLPATTVPR